MATGMYWHEVDEDAEDDPGETRISDSVPVFDRAAERLFSFSGPDHELNFND